ncbi:MAG: endopeptidase La [Gammaproteobacteria bacterium]|jgi:ATP-dependent Lon protease|nr:endopeptidase La [Gammaproteobacteria bacterium]
MNATSETSALLPVVPMKDGVVFPNMMLPMTVGRSQSTEAVEAALATEDKQIAIFAQRDASVEEPGAEDLYPIGTQCVIRRMQRQEGAIQLMLQGSRRIRRTEVVQETPYRQFRVELLPRLEDTDSEVEALHRTMLDLAARMLALGPPQMQINLQQMVSELDQPVEQAYVLASLLSIDTEKQHQLLAASSQIEALKLIVDYLNHEVKVLELQSQISSAVESKMSKEQQEHVLRQQLRAIQERLGEASPEQAEVAELRRRLEQTPVPDLVRGEVGKELSRLERISSSSPDYQITRSYVELALELPWEKTTEDNLDLQHARDVLDEDHFDLEEVKERIIEHLAVMKLNPQAKAPILCFVGPPGVGKTSLGQSIAKSLGRAFERMSLGGLHDEAELRGHRRTYIGAMPGRIIRAIRRAAVKNPLLMLDEIDKLGRDFRGDPAAALMEILDPAQNVEFHDNYLDLPFDLSKVFFIATANTLDTIPGPLLDRIEVLRLAGYSDAEKRQIARRYLLGRRLHEAGVAEDRLVVPDEALDYIIENHTREAGIRMLERALGRIARKLATRIADGDTGPVILDEALITEFLGPRKRLRESRRDSISAGIVAGLAWTEAGGDVLYVEALVLPGGKDLVLTGQLGNVMQESAQAARSYIQSRARQLGIDPQRIRKSGVHIHVPAGATPKDGPSAGVTMATALASAYLDTPVRDDTAMTGEITLSGMVLPVGGIKEKLLAAHRAGFKRVILPKDNEDDLTELSPEVRAEIALILADHIGEVFAAAIPGLGKDIDLRHGAKTEGR